MKTFHTTGVCVPDKHYMVNLSGRMAQIKAMIDAGKYFTINRARQYGKTTTLTALANYLKDDYLVIEIDFQDIGNSSFLHEGEFCKTFSRVLLAFVEDNDILAPDTIISQFDELVSRTAGDIKFDELFTVFKNWCKLSEKPIVLTIDEVDSATNNQVFLDFLAQLRSLYLKREKNPRVKTFLSVILAGVTDVKNLKQKLRPEDKHKFDSPWNIAADFEVDMSFTPDDIVGMLQDYEADHHTGMAVDRIAQAIYDYTGGYPFLVSRMCQYLDTKLPGTERFPDKENAWTLEGVNEAARLIVAESNTLFETMAGKLYDYPELRSIIKRILFNGEDIPLNVLEPCIQQAVMYGFIKGLDGKIVIANRIFETVFYNLFLTSQEIQQTDIWKMSNKEKHQFIENDRLNMEKILERYVAIFDDIYGDQGEKFKEEEGRKYFLLFLKPIINGTGNYYIESRTRNNERTDIIIDYIGTQYIVEVKLWHGKAYNATGEQQLIDYLEHYHLDKGYMLTYSFNKNKKIGVHHVQLGDKELIEAIV